MEPLGLRRSVSITGLVIGVLSAALFVSGAFEHQETKLYDKRLAALGAERLSPAIVLVQAPTPLDADAAARLIDDMKQAGVRSIVFNDPLAVSQGSIDALSKAMTEQGRVVLSFGFSGADVARLRQGEEPATPPDIPKQLQGSAAGIAFNTRLPGADGVLRRFTPSIAGFSEVGVAAASASRENLIDLPRQAPMLGERRQLGPGPRLLIRYQKANRGSAALTLEEASRHPGKLKGKTIIVGDAGGKIWDTPVGPMTDPEVTAQIASSLLLHKGITRAPVWVVVLALIAVSFAMTLGADQPSPFVDFALPLVLGAAIWILGGIFLRTGTWIDTYPLIFALIAQMVAVPVVRSMTRRAYAPKPARRSPYFEVLIETLMHGCFAHSGTVWEGDSQSFNRLASRGHVPDHLITGIHGHSLAEINRDEGQVVFIPIESGGFKGGATLVRERSMTLAKHRLSLIARVAKVFAEGAGASTRDEGRHIRRMLGEVAEILDENDHFPADHPQKIAQIATAIGRRAGISAKELDSLVPAAQLHDIGKIGVQDAVLDHTDRLSDDDYEKIKRHTLISESIVKAAGIPQEIAAACAAHHERWDGKGYPRGLAGEDIPVAARVLSIADALASMISDRPYRRGMSLETAMEEVAKQRARMFDPWLVEAAIEVALADPDLFRDISGANLREPA